MMMTFPSDKEKILPFDVFFARKEIDFSPHHRHYYVCIYKQEEDNHNVLRKDIYGLIVTTNNKYARMINDGYNDYNVQIEINGRPCYVCCDKFVRMEIDENVKKTQTVLSADKRIEIERKFKKFINETEKQIERFKNERTDIK